MIGLICLLLGEQLLAYSTVTIPFLEPSADATAPAAGPGPNWRSRRLLPAAASVAHPDMVALV